MIVNTTFTNRVYQHHRGLSFVEMLTLRFTYRDRESWLALIHDEIVLLNNIPTSPDAIVATDDSITYIVKDYNEPDVPTDYEKIYENNDVVLVCKPPQVPVQQTGRIIYNTMTNILRRDLSNNAIVPFHRIDRETSGLILFAKNNPFCKAHQKHLSSILHRKFYLALVSGSINYTHENISLPLGMRTDSPIRTKMYPNSGKQQISESTFHTIAQSDTHSLLLVEIKTGRKHQIRAQCEYLGHSIIGDKIYSHNGSYYLNYVNRDLEQDEIETLGSSRLLLHSFALDLHLPYLEPQLFTSTKTCSEFEKYCDSFNNWKEIATQRVLELCSDNEC
ncbi:MAG: RluA family pseudouridine synthase [Fibrobacterales bacterium]